ncbi:ATP-binding protein [Streptomyces sp. NPDC008317]|uniref:ATP-binding protein n=1 Tax=Streptomyces sp. NPDC008317 TaxID=3364827 RepID=UPI0036E1A663
MQTRTQKTLATTALGLAFAAAAAGTASAASLPALPITDQAGSLLGHAGSPTVLDGTPVGTAAKLLPGAADSANGAQQALTNGTSALPGNPGKLLPSGNQVSPANGLLGGLPVGGLTGK